MLAVVSVDSSSARVMWKWNKDKVVTVNQYTKVNATVAAESFGYQ